MEINITFVIQLINFVVILILLNVVLIRPVREILHKRRSMRYDLIRRAHAFTDQVAADMEKYEQTLRSAREDGARIRQQLREEGLGKQSELLASANAEAVVLIRNERERVEREAAVAKQELAAHVKALADDAAAKLLA